MPAKLDSEHIFGAFINCVSISPLGNNRAINFPPDLLIQMWRRIPLSTTHPMPDHPLLLPVHMLRPMAKQLLLRLTVNSHRPRVMTSMLINLQLLPQWSLLPPLTSKSGTLTVRRMRPLQLQLVVAAPREDLTDPMDVIGRTLLSRPLHTSANRMLVVEAVEVVEVALPEELQTVQDNKTHLDSTTQLLLPTTTPVSTAFP